MTGGATRKFANLPANRLRSGDLRCLGRLQSTGSASKACDCFIVSMLCMFLASNPY